MLYWPIPNALYVEGYALDRFAEGHWALQPVHQNKVGLVLDAGIEEELRVRHLQVADATRASLGLPVIEYIVTDTPLKVEKWIDPKCGKSTGRIGNSDSLLRAVDFLANHSEVNAVAVAARFPDDDDTEDLENYRQGKFQYTPQHLVRLLQIIVDGNNDMAVRQVASIHFKNFVAKNWSPIEPGEPQKISENDKAMVRENILGFIVQVPPLLRVQLGECMKTIIHADYPEQWPGLLHWIKGNLQLQDQQVFGALMY